MALTVVVLLEVTGVEDEVQMVVDQMVEVLQMADAPLIQMQADDLPMTEDEGQRHQAEGHLVEEGHQIAGDQGHQVIRAVSEEEGGGHPLPAGKEQRDKVNEIYSTFCINYPAIVETCMVS